VIIPSGSSKQELVGLAVVGDGVTGAGVGATGCTEGLSLGRLDPLGLTDEVTLGAEEQRSHVPKHTSNAPEECSGSQSAGTKAGRSER
jgi:hypothetical protein